MLCKLGLSPYFKITFVRISEKSWQFTLKEGACRIYPYYKVNEHLSPSLFFPFLPITRIQISTGALYLYREVIPRATASMKVLSEELLIPPPQVVFLFAFSGSGWPLHAVGRLSNPKWAVHFDHHPGVQRGLITQLRGLSATVLSGCGGVLGLQQARRHCSIGDFLGLTLHTSVRCTVPLSPGVSYSGGIRKGPLGNPMRLTLQTFSIVYTIFFYEKMIDFSKVFL